MNVRTKAIHVSRHLAVLSTVSLLIFMPDRPVRAQRIHSSAYASLIAYREEGGIGRSNWEARKWEYMDPQGFKTQLKDLHFAAKVWANDRSDHFPLQASQLFYDGYVTDPLVYFRIGDDNAPPTTIDNDAPNAGNSAQISYEFLAGDWWVGLPRQISFRENSPAYNGGLGRYVVYTDDYAEFVPEVPHPFMDAQLWVHDRSYNIITRAPFTPYEPYSFELPADAVAGAVIAPHHMRARAEGSISQPFLEVFEKEGWGDFANSFVLASAGGVFIPSMTLSGPGGAKVTFSTVVEFSATLTRFLSDLGRNSAQASVSFTVYSESSTGLGRSAVSLGESGAIAVGAPTILEQRLLTPMDPDYVDGADTLVVHAIAHLRVEVPPQTKLSWLTSQGVLVSRGVTPTGPLGQLQRGTIDALSPSTPAGDRLVVYAPPGYELVLDPVDGPADLILTARPGDFTLDGGVDELDLSEFANAMSNPIGGYLYHKPTVEALAAFDFDADGDIDCTDFESFKLAWTAGGAPGSIGGCAPADSDGDGIPYRDDECTSTPKGVEVDQRGCGRGDFFTDGFLDLLDVGAFAQCMVLRVQSGSTLLTFLPPPPLTPAQCTNAFDFTHEGGVDLADFAALQNLFHTER